MMTPGDFASLQEGREGLSTEDYIAWKLPEEEDPDEYPFPLTLKKPTPLGSPNPAASVPAAAANPPTSNIINGTSGQASGI